jgi:hypothetical protein
MLTILSQKKSLVEGLKKLFFHYQEYEIQIDFLNQQIQSEIIEKTQFDHKFKELEIEFKA